MFNAVNSNAAADATTARRRSRWSPPPPPPPRAMSDSSSGTVVAHRKYVDPWDLDLREVSWRHSSDTTDCSADQVVSLSSAAGPESTRSDFVYVPGPLPPPQPKRKSSGGGDRTRSRSVARYDCCQCSPKSSMALRPPGPIEAYECWEPGCKRRQPPPPPYRYVAATVDDRFYQVAIGQSNQRRLLYNVSRPEVRRNSRYNNSGPTTACRGYETTSSGEYDPAEEAISSQFGYNTLGHMKIDYSSNWNNLDKYICQV